MSAGRPENEREREIADRRSLDASAMNAPAYTRQMDRWHAYSHAPGILLGVAALVLTVTQAARFGGAALVVGCALYGVSVILLYGASTCYHAARNPSVKRFFRACDHACIYLLIAGTYSPFAMGPLAGPLGWTIFGLIWGFALAGVAKAIIWPVRGGILSTVFYLGMSWLAIIAIVPLWQNLPASAFWWLATGGLAYTAGTAFYGWRNLPGNHLIWHGFVLAGSACHLVSILIFITAM